MKYILKDQHGKTQGYGAVDTSGLDSHQGAAHFVTKLGQQVSGSLELAENASGLKAEFVVYPQWVAAKEALTAEWAKPAAVQTEEVPTGQDAAAKAA